MNNIQIKIIWNIIPFKIQSYYIIKIINMLCKIIETYITQLEYRIFIKDTFLIFIAE